MSAKYTPVIALLAAMSSFPAIAQNKAQNNFYTPQSPSKSTDMGLTNPAGSTVFIPTQPPHPLAGTPPPPPTDPTHNNAAATSPMVNTPTIVPNTITR